MSIHITPQGKEVLGWWHSLTGQEIRVPNFLHGRQCQTIVETYTREDVELTVRYMKAEIAANEANGRKGLNARSLTWANFFGPDEECSKFADNWNLAKLWAARRQKASPAPIKPAEPSSSLHEAGVAAMAATLQRLKGKA
jgi:hypothetical protein